MMAFQDRTIHDVANKVGDYNKTGGVPRPKPQAVTEHMMQLGEQMSTAICEGKGQHTWALFACTGLSSLLAYSNKSPRLILI